MRRIMAPVFVAMGIISMFLSACGATATDTPASSKAVKTAEDYLNALAAKDTDRIAALSCAAWEPNARMEVDSFQAVEIRLEGLACQETGTDGTTTLVICQGKLLATYDNEEQELDLSLRTYEVVQEGGEYLVCGYR